MREPASLADLNNDLVNEFFLTQPLMRYYTLPALDKNSPWMSYMYKKGSWVSRRSKEPPHMMGIF
jgi:hypothetical protein